MFQRLLICTDLSDGLQRLVNFVPSLAAANIQQITFLHCVALNESGAIPRVDSEKIERVRQQLAIAPEHNPNGIQVAVEVKCGRPVDLILKAIKEHQIDLLMIGYPMRNAFSEKVFGSTAAELYAKTTIPVLSIRPQLISTYTSEELDLRLRHIFRHFMVPYDGTEAAKYLLQKVKQCASQQPSLGLQACNICWVLDDVERRDIPQEPFIEKAEKELQQVKHELEAVGLQVTTEVRRGTPIVEVVNAALAPDISAIIVCRSARSKFLQVSVRSFTRELLHYSWYPILYFPYL